MIDYKTIIEIVDKLIGPCCPCGDSIVDKERYESMRKKIMVLGSFLDDIMFIARDCRDNHESSIIKAREAAIKYLKTVAEWLNENIEELEERK